MKVQVPLKDVDRLILLLTQSLSVFSRESYGWLVRRPYTTRCRIDEARDALIRIRDADNESDCEVFVLSVGSPKSVEELQNKLNNGWFISSDVTSPVVPGNEYGQVVVILKRKINE